MLMTMLRAVDRTLRWPFLIAVWGYQRFLGWLLGGQCRFVPSCSFYAEEALIRGSLLRALGLIAWRLARCQPLCKGGFDPVPGPPEPDPRWALQIRRLPKPVKR